MMEFETWKREELINEVKTAMMLAAFKPHGDFLGMPITIKCHTDKELSQKTDYELRCIYVQYKKCDDDFRQKYEENEEGKRFFNQPTANADINYWSKQAYWTIDEAIALALGKDPRKVTWDNIKPYLQYSPFAERFSEIRELARRYVNCKELSETVYPGVFLAWAKRMRLDLPIMLIDAVTDIGVQVADWKSHYEQSSKQLEQTNTHYRQALTLCNEKDNLINALNFKIKSLENSSQHRNEIEPREAKLGETERQSLYKLIAAMAYAGYSYNPGDKKSPVATELANDVSLTLGEKIDRDTALKWLKTTTEQYPKATINKTE